MEELREDDMSQKSWSPTKLPKYKDNHHVKFMTDVKQDLNFFKTMEKVGKSAHHT